MRKLKWKERVCSLILCFLMVFTSVPVSAEEVDVKPTFSSFELYKSSDDYNDGKDPLTITPEFTGSTYEGYTAYAPDYLSRLYAVAEISEETLNSGISYSVMASNQWGWSGASVSSGIMKANAYFAKGYVSVYFSQNWENVAEYQINVEQYTTLSNLVIDGVMDTSFDRDTNNYHVYVDSLNEGVDITPTAYNSAYTISMNGESVTSAETTNLKYDWEEDGTMEVSIVVSGEGKKDSTYTVTLEKMPLEAAPYLMTQPESADYIQGDSAEALSVVASANGELAYQWYCNDTDSNENGTAIASATEATYVPSTQETGTTYYYCVVTNTGAESENTAVSDTACVIVDPDPTPIAIIKNPGSALSDVYGWDKGYVYDADEEAKALTVEASSLAEGGEYSYQWWKIFGNPYNVNSYGSASGVTTESTYTPSTALSLANEAGYYYGCKVSYKFKGKTYTAWATTGDTYTVTNADGSEGETYDVNGVYVFIEVEEAATPEITAQPVSVEYIVGDSATNLSVSAKKADGGKLTYQWYVNDKNSTEEAEAIEGATSSSYSLGVATEEGNKYYFCEITNTLQGYTSSVTSDIAEIKVQSLDEVVGDSFDGSGTEEDPYQLKTAEDFDTLADWVAKGISFKESYFVLMNEVTLNDNWNGIGALKEGTTATSNGKNINPFSGTLDGNDKTLTFPYGSMPLFKYVRNAVVEDLNIYGEYIAEDGLVSDYVVDYGPDGSYYSGEDGGSYVAGCPDTIDIYNVTIKSGTTIKGSGLISGYASGANIINIIGCTAEEGVKIGWDADADASAEASKIGSFGGDFNGTITDCTSAATVYGVNYVGGIVGSKGQSIGPYSISNCSFTGEVIATGTMIGGIAGGGYTSSSAPNSPCASVENCYVAGTITGASKVGGIFGGEAAVSQCWANGTGYIRNNHFYGTVKGTEEEAVVGGIIGYMHSLDRYNVIENNYFVEDCGAENGIGQINEANVDRTSENYGREDDPLGADADKLTKVMEKEAFSDGTVKDLLNLNEFSFHNWIQEEDYPVHSDETIAYKLEVSGEYKTEFLLGEELDLSGIELTASLSDGTVKDLSLEEVSITGYDNTKQGKQTLLISYGAATAELTVSVLKPENEEITITFTVLGDDLHDSSEDGAVHTLTDGNLTTWVEEKEYTVSANDTVKDVLEMILTENGMTWENPSGNYVQNITKENVAIGEFTNGNNSGWMFTVNGKHGNLGVEEQYMEEGDVIVFHYTDDYSKEVDRIDDIDVNVTISVAGSVKMAQESVAVSDRNGDGKFTVDEVLYAAHEAGYTGGAEEGYGSAYGAWGLAITKLWGDESGCYGYWLNNASCWSLEDEVVEGDYLSAFVYTDKTYWSDSYGKFDSFVYAVDAEVSVTLEKSGYDSNWNTIFNKVTGASIKVYDASGKEVDSGLYQIKEDGDGVYTIVFKEDGEYTLIAEDTETIMVPAVCRVSVEEGRTDSDVDGIYESTGDYIEALGTPGVGSIGGEWMVLGLARSGRNVPTAYYDAVVAYVKANINEKGQLHRAKSTENSRVILALTAAGYDVTNVGGYNLLTGLSDMTYVQKQGINGPIWALIALDSHDYEIPENADAKNQVTRDKLITAILEAQLEDGGWTLSGDQADVDITAMAIQALAPYYTSNA